MGLRKKEEMYDEGVLFAEHVQAGLQSGQSFDDMTALTPEQAMTAQDAWQASEAISEETRTEAVQFWRGYLSRWD